jgi:hypothetical protein
MIEEWIMRLSVQKPVKPSLIALIFSVQRLTFTAASTL